MSCSFFSSRFFSRTVNLSSGVDVVHATRQVCCPAEKTAGKKTTRLKKNCVHFQNGVRLRQSSPIPNTGGGRWFALFSADLGKSLSELLDQQCRLTDRCEGTDRPPSPLLPTPPPTPRHASLSARLRLSRFYLPLELKARIDSSVARVRYELCAAFCPTAQPDFSIRTYRGQRTGHH